MPMRCVPARLAKCFVTGSWRPRSWVRSCAPFTFGHARQLDMVTAELLKRAWSSGAGVGDEPLTIDLDSTICETYGLNKEGGSRFTYTHVRGYHPLLAIAAKCGDVLHCRLRGGPSHAGRGAASFVTESVNRARAAGAHHEITVRADSSFYNHKVVNACRRRDVRFSITVRLSPVLHKAIAAHRRPGVDADRLFSGRRRSRRDDLHAVRNPQGCPHRAPDRQTSATQPREPAGAVQRVQLPRLCHRQRGRHAHPGGRPPAPRRGREHHPRSQALDGAQPMPSGRFGANAAWLVFNTIAHNLVRWVTRIGLGEKLVTTKTIRRRYLSLPGRITRSVRRLWLHLPRNWPWRERFLTALARLRAIPPPLIA